VARDGADGERGTGEAIVNGGSAPDAVVLQGHRTGNEAARPGVEQGRQLFLRNTRDPVGGNVDAGQQYPPWSAHAYSVLHGGVLHAEREQLPAADDGELLLQELGQAAGR
jgi:hypothetical protein